MPKSHAAIVRLARILARARRAAGISQRELAERMGVPASRVARVETGDRRLDVPEFVSYCRALGANPRRVLAAFLAGERRGGGG